MRFSDLETLSVLKLIEGRAISAADTARLLKRKIAVLQRDGKLDLTPEGRDSLRKAVGWNIPIP